MVGSKEELLVSVMQPFAATVTASWEAVLDADATTVEKLDALTWVNINTLDRHSEEFRIQLGWVLESPPAAELGWSFKTRLREIKALLREGGSRPGVQHVLRDPNEFEDTLGAGVDGAVRESDVSRLCTLAQ